MKQLWKRIKEKMGDLLEKMAEENAKSFGSAKLDCCKLNNHSVPKSK